MKIYLAGSVPKGDNEAKKLVDWRKRYSEVISKISGDFELFDPNNFYLNSLEGNPKLVFGADCLHIRQNDLIIVNAEEKDRGIGAGTAMEFVIAKYFRKPVITVLPKDSYHRRPNLLFCGKLVEDWIHPFVDSMSDIHNYRRCVRDKKRDKISGKQKD